MSKARQRLFQKLAKRILKELRRKVTKLSVNQESQTNPGFVEKTCTEIIDVIANRTANAYFQPVVDLKTGLIFGYEALIRGPVDSAVHLPKDLFHASCCCNLEKDIEKLCVSTVLEAADSLIDGMKLFININPAYLGNILIQENESFGLKVRGMADKIIVEISEGYVSPGMAELMPPHRRTFGLAVDKCGMGYNNPLDLAVLRPDYIKLDKTIISGVGKSGYQRAVIQAMVEHARSFGARIIAVGIETKDELRQMMELGVDFAQGHFFCEPSSAPLNIRPEAADCLLKLKRFTGGEIAEVFNLSIGQIAKPGTTVPPAKIVSEAAGMIEEDKVQGIVVVDGHKPVGLVMKNTLYYHLGGHYGVSLYYKRPVELIMDKQPLVVDMALALETVSKMAMAREEAKLYDLIIVTRDGAHYGAVSIMDLLQQLTELQIRSAANSNPLTGLPGNLLIEDKLKKLVEKSDGFAVLYVDLDNFKAFNDKYGFERGDMVIELTAAILRSCVAAHADATVSFVGHIGGDDFVIMTSPEKAADMCHYIITEFNERIKTLYPIEDLAQGYITVPNRKGDKENYPIMTISIAVVDNEQRMFGNYLEIVEIAAQLKKRAKMLEGSVWVSERRNA
jgi:diguanylate cyclase (GGDEF)-like protein